MHGACPRGWSRALGCVLVAALCAVAPSYQAGCLSPTQVTLVLTTDVDCKQLLTTTITTAAPGDAKAVPAATTSTCQNGGDIGTLVLVPSGDRDGHVDVEVVTAVGVPAAACTRPAYGPGCIVARRSLGFLPHTGLTLPIAMRDACRGVICGPADTCVSGVCRSAAVDPNACEAAGGCSEAVLGPPASPLPLGDGGAGDASKLDASTLDADLPDAAPGAPELLYSGTREIDSIALGEANVFFLESPTDFGTGDGAVRFIPKAGGAGTLLAGALFQPVSLAANGTSLFWFENGALQTVAKSGGLVSTVILAGGVGTTPLSVQADNSFVYWGTSPAGSGAVIQAQTNGQKPVTHGTATGGVLNVALDKGAVAYASRVNADNTGEIRYRGPADINSSLVATTSSLNVALLTLVALSGDKLAWSDGDGGGTLMVKNGAQTTVLATGQGAIFAIAIDQTDIYWFHGAGKEVMLERATWAGQRTTLLTGKTFTQALALDASYLYFSQTSTSASLYRLHR
jgi:hypothetical protein